MTNLLSSATPNLFLCFKPFGELQSHFKLSRELGSGMTEGQEDQRRDKKTFQTPFTEPILQLSTTEGQHPSPAVRQPFSLGMPQTEKQKGPTTQVTCTSLGRDKRLKRPHSLWTQNFIRDVFTHCTGDLETGKGTA